MMGMVRIESKEVDANETKMHAIAVTGFSAPNLGVGYTGPR
jgi:hypothetical protein